MAAALGLAGGGCRVELFEASPYLGGRAGGFFDAATGHWLDRCQHVTMGCCTNLADFCCRLGIAGGFARVGRLHFATPEGGRYPFAASRRLPAPLHLVPALVNLRYLSLAERWSIIRALGRLARQRGGAEETMADWLRRQGQSPRAVERFWNAVLVSALSEVLERVSVAAARKVFVDGFLRARTAWEVSLPAAPLVELYDRRAGAALAALGVILRRGTRVRTIAGAQAAAQHLVAWDGRAEPFQAFVLAVPWRKAARLLDGPLGQALPRVAEAAALPSAPITAVHLWFDRPPLDGDHAVLVGGLSQWVFRRRLAPPADRPGSDGGRTAPLERGGHYCQVVVSAAHTVAGQPREAVVDAVCGELARMSPAAASARRLHARLVTERHAVFSMLPGIERLRPPQRTAVPNLALAGDWTATGWPATMEGAVRSGYLAAEAILDHLGRPARRVVPDLPPAPLAARLFGLSATQPPSEA